VVPVDGSGELGLLPKWGAHTTLTFRIENASFVKTAITGRFPIFPGYLDYFPVWAEYFPGSAATGFSRKPLILQRFLWKNRR
jgi:hypothetical protein